MKPELAEAEEIYESNFAPYLDENGEFIGGTDLTSTYTFEDEEEFFEGLAYWEDEYYRLVDEINSKTSKLQQITNQEKEIEAQKKEEEDRARAAAQEFEKEQAAIAAAEKKAAQAAEAKRLKEIADAEAAEK